LHPFVAPIGAGRASLARCGVSSKSPNRPRIWSVVIVDLNALAHAAMRSTRPVAMHVLNAGNKCRILSSFDQIVYFEG